LKNLIEIKLSAAELSMI